MGKRVCIYYRKTSCINSRDVVWQYSRNRLGGGGNMKKKILTLTVSKQWFDMIVSGEKTEEYRAPKSYWIKRLLVSNSDSTDMKLWAEAIDGRVDIISQYIHTNFMGFKPYTHVLFINGYRKDSPRIEKEIESITIGKPKKGLCPDKWLDTEFFVIKFK